MNKYIYLTDLRTLSLAMIFALNSTDLCTLSLAMILALLLCLSTAFDLTDL